eukprot:scaffold12771_cov86-Skeletonema_menzelii.AAC.3
MHDTSRTRQTSLQASSSVPIPYYGTMATLNAFREGFVKKEVLAATLRAHKEAEDATKSPQREAAAENNQD